MIGHDCDLWVCVFEYNLPQHSFSATFVTVLCAVIIMMLSL